MATTLAPGRYTHEELMHSAEVLARVRGSVSATYTVEYRDVNGVLVSQSATWTRGVDPETY